jgi:hypothetical protein
LTPGRKDAPNRLFATLRANETAHANTAAFKGLKSFDPRDPQDRHDRKINHQNGHLKPDTQGSKHPPPPTDESILDRAEIRAQHESFFEWRLTLSVTLSAGNMVPGTLIITG